MQPISSDEVVLGQYVADPEGEGEARLGFREDPGCPPDSRQCTFASAVCWVRNERWDGRFVYKHVCSQQFVDLRQICSCRARSEGF